MAKNIGLEVLGTQPVCIDFRDGRTVSFRPKQRFEAMPTNPSVLRLLKNRQLRKLSPYEKIPALPVKIGASPRVRNVMQARKQVEDAKRAAELRTEASRRAPAEPELVDLGSDYKKTTKKKKKKTSSKSITTSSEDN